MSNATKENIYPWLVMIGFFFLGWGSIGTILCASGVFFVPVCGELGFSFSGLSWWVTCYAFGMAISMPFVGRLLPRVDTRLLLSLAFLVAISAMGIMSTYHHLWQWYLSGLMIGLSGGFVFLVPGPVVLSNWFLKRRGLAIGVAGMGICIGAAVMGPVGDFLITHYGWRLSYIILAAICCVLVLPWTLFVIRYSPEICGKKPYGWEPAMSEDGCEDSSSGVGVPFKKAAFSLSFLCLFFVSGSALDGGFSQHWPNIALTFGYTTSFGAKMISMTYLPGIILIPLAGWLNDRIGARKTSLLLVFCVACSFLGFLTLYRIPWVVILCCILFTAQSPVVSVQIPLMAREIFGARDYAKVLSTIQIGIGLVGAFSAPIIGSFYDLTGSYRGSLYFGLIVSLTVCCLILVAYYGKRRLVWENCQNLSKPIADIARA